MVTCRPADEARLALCSGVGTIIEGDIFGDGIKQVTAVITAALDISDLNVVVNITHGWDSDLSLRLRGPDGTTVTLSNRRGGNGNNYTDTVFDDEATRTIASGTPPFTGSYRPETPLSAFDGKTTNGTWILEIQDHISDQDGVLNGWQLRFGLDCR